MLELKLVAEIKERADKKKHQLKESPPHELVDTQTFGDPVTRLVSELSESLNLEARRERPRPSVNPTPAPAPESDCLSPGDLKSTLRKTTYNKTDVDVKTTDFKSQLKKVDTNRIINSKDDEAGRAIIDFKSRLRKVDSTPATNGTAKKEQTSPDDKQTKKESDLERKPSESGSLDTSGADDEDKRRSTGSISSLKKLWENKDSDDRLSPKLRPRGEESTDTSPEGSGVARSGSLNKREDKPVVPSKPAVKGKPVKGGIYATPLSAPQAPASTGGTDETDEEDALTALKASLDWCTAEVSEFFLAVFFT